MAKKKKNRKKELRKHLTGMLMIHLDAHSLPVGKSKKLRTYLDKKIAPVVDYYLRLLTKKRVKRMIKEIKSPANDKGDKVQQ